MYTDDDVVAISALQHYLYCPRQCALIHVEQQWAENRYTAEGRVLHGRADVPGSERRHGVRTVRAMPLSCAALGISGVADVVEFRDENGCEIPVPVEYKRGRPKPHRADEVQLCAQALCLEAMLGAAVTQGALFYGKTRRRKVVVFDEELRRLTLETIQATRAMIRAGNTPAACYEEKRCAACSLIELCQPRALNKVRDVQAWLRGQIAEEP